MKTNGESSLPIIFCNKPIESVGEITTSMLYANLGDQFTNGRQASAFTCLTPKQYSSGGKVTMIGINTFGGVKDLRSMLYLGVMVYIYRLPDSLTNQRQAWLIKLVNRVGFKRACIALGNKTVRTGIFQGSCHHLLAY